MGIMETQGRKPMLDDEVLMEIADRLMTEANEDLSALVSRLHKQHWNGALTEQRVIIIAVADLVRRYNMHREGNTIVDAFNLATAEVMNNPNVQGLVTSLVKRKGGLQ